MPVSCLDSYACFIGEYAHEHNIRGGDLAARDLTTIMRRPQLSEGFFV
jgi:hypothetical protein